jgi:hypothetical protein
MLKTIVPKRDIITNILPESVFEFTFLNSHANNNIRINASMIKTNEMGLVKAIVVVSGEEKK